MATEHARANSGFMVWPCGLYRATQACLVKIRIYVKFLGSWFSGMPFTAKRNNSLPLSSLTHGHSHGFDIFFYKPLDQEQ